MNAFIFATVLPTLLVAHNLADHVVQTDHQAAHKASSWRAMLGHISGYTLTAAAFLAVLWVALDVRPDWRWALAGLAFSAASHAFIDRRWPVLALLARTESWDFANTTVRTTPNPNGTGEHVGAAPINGMYVADQALHWGCLFVSALLISAGAA